MSMAEQISTDKNQKGVRNMGASPKIRSLVGLGALVFIFVAVFFVNDNTVNELELSSKLELRGVASVHPLDEAARDTSWQKKLATQIAGLPLVPNGKLARLPSPMEALLFGELKGYYLMSLKQEKVSEMLLRNSGVSDAPKYFGEELSFLQKNRDLWWLNFSQVKLKERGPQKSVVDLLDSSHHIVGEALFSWDPQGRMLSLKVEKR